MEIKEAQKQSFKIIDDWCKKHGKCHDKNTVFPHLIEEIGELAREFNNGINGWRSEFDKEKLAEEMADVLGQLFNFATDNDIDLEEAFVKKIKKLRERFELE